MVRYLLLVGLFLGTQCFASAEFEISLLTYQELMYLPPAKRLAYLNKVGKAIANFEMGMNKKLAEGNDIAASSLPPKVFSDFDWLPKASAEENLIRGSVEKDPSGRFFELKWYPPGTSVEETITIAPEQITNYRPFINALEKRKVPSSNFAIPDGNGGWKFYGENGQTGGSIPNDKSVTIYSSNPPKVVHPVADPKDTAAVEERRKNLEKELGISHPEPAPTAQGPDTTGGEKHSGGACQGKNYPKLRKRYLKDYYKHEEDNKATCLIGGLSSTYQGNTPKAGRCMPRTMVGDKDVCKDQGIAGPATMCNPLLACKKRAEGKSEYICVRADKHAFENCRKLRNPNAICDVADFPDADEWRKLKATLTGVCKHHIGKDLFCWECQELQAAIGTTAAANTPPAGTDESGVTPNGGVTPATR